MNEISQLARLTDAEAASLVSPAAHADLTQRITQAGVPAAAAASAAAASAAAAPARRSRLRRSRRWLALVPAAAALAAAVLVVASAGTPGQHVGPVAVGPAQAQALSFRSSGGYLVVTVRNPVADAARFNAEFAARHLRIRLSLVPASPSIVGTLVFFDQTAGSAPLVPITARGRCYTGGGGPVCPVGLKIPLSFHGQAAIVFGRAARPGEQYETTGSAFAPGEALHGLHITGQTVALVLAELAQRHVTVAYYNVTSHNDARNLRHVPLTWHVYDASPWAAGQVMLVAGPTPTQPPAAPPAKGTPVPTPSPTAP